MNNIKIAGNLTIQQWSELVTTLHQGKDEKWDLAFRFFEERIRTRYLRPIHTILKMNDNLGEGFAIVSLQCSLIETIESFINGCIHEYDMKSEKLKWKRNRKIIFHSNRSIFKSFFEKRSPFSKFKISGNQFYEYVRCPILHETQTKNNWKIRQDVDKTGLSYLENEDEKIIYRENFQRDLEILIENYKNALINGLEFDGILSNVLRENFIAKFNHICKVS